MGMNVKIKNLRKAKGLSQEQLSEYIGVSLQTIRRWEWGATTPNSKLLSELANVLGTTPEYLLDTTEVNDLPVRPNTEQDDKLPFKNTGNALIYERNGERLELPPTEESYKIFRDIAMRIAERSNTPAIA